MYLIRPRNFATPIEFKQCLSIDIESYGGSTAKRRNEHLRLVDVPIEGPIASGRKGPSAAFFWGVGAIPRPTTVTMFLGRIDGGMTMRPYVDSFLPERGRASVLFYGTKSGRVR